MRVLWSSVITKLVCYLTWKNNKSENRKHHMMCSYNRIFMARLIPIFCAYFFSVCLALPRITFHSTNPHRAHCCAIFLWRLGGEISISFSWATNYSIALYLSVSMLGSQVYIWLIVPPSHNNAFIILVGLQLTYVQNRDISTVAKLRVKSLSKRAKFVIKRTCKLIFWLIPQTRILLTAATCEILEEMKVCPVGIWRLSRLNGNLIRFKLNQRRKGGTFATSQAWYITRPWYVLNWIRGSFSRSTRQTELDLNNGKIL